MKLLKKISVLIMIVVLLLSAVALAGCQDDKKPRNRDVKLRDLSPTEAPKDLNTGRLKGINMLIYTVEVPATNQDKLNKVWEILFGESIFLHNEESFNASKFMAGFGRGFTWNNLGVILRQAGYNNSKQSSLILFDGISENYPIAKIEKPRKIFYADRNGQVTSEELPQGELFMRITAYKIPGSRGVCTLELVPIFLNRQELRSTQYGYDKPGDPIFDSLALRLKISPGEFIYLGSDSYINNQMTLSGLYFSKPEPEPTVRSFVIACTDIVD